METLRWNPQTMPDSFYSAIDPVDNFEALVRPESYTPLPEDWALVVADVVDSRGGSRRVSTRR